MPDAEKNTRPWCCPEPRCTPLHLLAEAVAPGESFVCFGKAPEVEFTYDGVAHSNDLRSCHYTPLKGLIAYQENRDDWEAMRTGYWRALTALDAPEPPPPEAPMPDAEKDAANAIVRSMRTLVLSGLPEHRQGLADSLDDLLAHVWDKGYASGHSNAMRRMSDEPNAPTTPNPFRVTSPEHGERMEPPQALCPACREAGEGACWTRVTPPGVGA